ncbi:hypothetical protein X739_21215 [Mesorhizobium sp. LNHC220B00]|nr:hypothetical protein X739_21215 [Mesorhizobium sp. LNHC220B00]
MAAGAERQKVLARVDPTLAQGLEVLEVGVASYDLENRMMREIKVDTRLSAGEWKRNTIREHRLFDVPRRPPRAVRARFSMPPPLALPVMLPIVAAVDQVLAVADGRASEMRAPRTVEAPAAGTPRT